jgi:hypothetical protein
MRWVLAIMDGHTRKAKRLAGKTASGHFGAFLNITYGNFNTL